MSERERLLNEIAMESSRRMRGTDFRVDYFAAKRRPKTFVEAMDELAVELRRTMDAIAGPTDPGRGY